MTEQTRSHFILLTWGLVLTFGLLNSFMSKDTKNRLISIEMKLDDMNKEKP